MAFTSLAPAVEWRVPCSPPPMVRDGQVYAPTTFLTQQLHFVLEEGPAGARRLRWYGREFPLAAAQPAADGQPRAEYLPVDALLEALGARVSADCDAVVLSTPLASVVACRAGGDGQRLRVVYELSAPAPFALEYGETGVSLEMPAQLEAGIAESIPVDDRLGRAVYVRPDGPERIRTTVALRYRAPVRAYTLGAPPRIVLDFERLYDVRREHQLSPAVRWTQIDMGVESGPIHLNVANVQLTGGVDVRPVICGPNLFVRTTTSAAARRVNARVAVNGGFFARQGPPLGLVVVDREIIKTPIHQRTGVAISAGGRLEVARFGARGHLRVNDRNLLPVAALNESRGGERGLFVYSPWWGDAVRVEPDQMALVVRDGRALAYQTNMRCTIPFEGFVVVGDATLRDSILSVPLGAAVECRYELHPFYQNLTHVLAAGPRLVSDGVLNVTANREVFRNDVANGRAPRTAIGVTDDGRLLLVTVDGRQPSHSIGMTLWELARFMLQLQCRDAVNLDGGGSTTFVVDGQVVNRPSDGRERKVSNILAVIEKERRPAAAFAEAR